MSRYIDAELINYTPQHFWSDEYGDKYDIVTRSEIDDIPTAGVQPVIYCKDCKYWNKEDGEYCEELSNEIGWSEDEYYRVYTDKNDFCSHAERK